MEHTIGPELIDICKLIVREDKFLEEWCAIESDDMFQTVNYCGGFDATEGEFCFSLFQNDDKEYWFQFSLDVAYRIADGSLNYISTRIV